MALMGFIADVIPCTGHQGEIMSQDSPVLDPKISSHLQQLVSRCDLYPHVVQGSGTTLKLISEDDTVHEFDVSEIVLCFEYDEAEIMSGCCSNALLVVGQRAFGISWYEIDDYHHFYMKHIETNNYYFQEYEVKDPGWSTVFSPRAQGSTTPIVQSMLEYIDEQAEHARDLHELMTTQS